MAVDQLSPGSVILTDVKSTLTHLECPECERQYDHRRVQTICAECNAPLEAMYDLAEAAKTLSLDAAGRRPGGIWRWGEVLPVSRDENQLTLGEGDTPLVPARRLGESIGLGQLCIKDESGNPTGSFKARGLAVAVAKALELGLKEFVIPTAGNAGAALAAYAARAKAVAHVYMPKDAPTANQVEVRAFGAELVLVDGTISDAGKLASAEGAKHRWFDVSTFKEPYRLEGKKTMGLELAEHYRGDLPDVILYPTGGGTGLVGMWKAFREMEAMGWVSARRPRMVSVQAAGCAPVVKAVTEGRDRTVPWTNAKTEATGLRVPAPFADRMILRAIRDSGGTAVAVRETEIEEARNEMATLEGILASPEGAATWAALKHLAANGWVRPENRVVLFNTGSGLKYI